MERYICIHGHFYQPPRENPWLEAVEVQDSAYPYHDWNERITAECYAANAASRILDSKGRIVDIVNNYSRISFNFGPTLMAWLERAHPDVYQAILTADRVSQANYSGHGSAIAQVYNHIIMPLANRRDKVTQIRWGIRDFEHHFGRPPEGAWLAETAVDLETLDLLAEHGIQFTILSPYQAQAVRKIGDDEWQEVRDARIDPTRAYVQRLPSGRSIALFFYDAPISRAIAFEGLLAHGEDLAHRLVNAFSGKRSWPQLVHVATDGETYGHHHAYGDMALAYALRYIESNRLARLTNYGEYLEKVPPTHEVQITENSSWSCFHGVERWASHCGCNSGGNPKWNQEWRKPLREALDWLRDSIAPLYEKKARAWLTNPWAARDDYIQVVLDRSADSRDTFLARHARHELSRDERVSVWKLLEMQRHALLMYTSCGWFFDELSGLETVQTLSYAGRAVQLAQELFGDSIESGFGERLAQAQSNLPEHGGGRQIFEKRVKPTVVDLPRVGANYAVASLFDGHDQPTSVYCYRIVPQDYRTLDIGRSKLAIGQARVTSEITEESEHLTFAVLHFGDHTLIGGVRPYRGQSAYLALVAELNRMFEQADLPGVIRCLEQHLELTYPWQSTFRDDQRRIATLILRPTVAVAKTTYRRLYEEEAPIMRFMTGLHIPLPREVLAAAEMALNSALCQALSAEPLDLQHISALLEEARRTQVALDGVTAGHTLQEAIERLAVEFRRQPSDPARLAALNAILDVRSQVPISVNLWKPQNLYYETLQTVYPEWLARSAYDPAAQAWVKDFAALGDKLGIVVPQIIALHWPRFDTLPAPPQPSARATDLP